MAKKNRRPNIILIMSDDLQYEALSCNGGTAYRTPELDRLAETGMRFENAHVMPLCTPTRVSLMTGKYNFRNYIGFGLMRPDEVTFGHLMSDAGYKTCISGKWQLYSYNPPQEMPEMRSKGQRIEDAGFQEFCVWHAHHTEEKGSRYKDPIIFENGKFREDTKGKYGEDIFCDNINDFMERNRDEEFFVYWPMPLTHRPFEPTPDSPDYEEFEPPSNQTLGSGTWAELEGWPDDPEYYKDMVEYHDKVIGRMMRKLDELGLREDTLVIYLGDNGSPREVCTLQHNHRQLCGGKGLTNDRGTHVPLICNWPGTIPPAVVQTDLIDNCDYLPTILEAAAAPVPEGYVIDGQSFLPQLRGEPGNSRDWIFFHFDPQGRNPMPPRRFLRDHRWKLYEDGRLFDLDVDQEEKLPILREDDTPEQAAARAKLEPVFARMAPDQEPVLQSTLK